MMLKLLGALMVFFGCGGFGYLIAASHRREVKSLQHLVAALEFMCNDLQFRQTPLPELCEQTANTSKGVVQSFFASLANELMRQISPDVKKCVDAVLLSDISIPKQTYALMSRLGECLGRFDLAGQLNDLESVRLQAEGVLNFCTKNQESRLRSYQTLGLCAGAAMAILFV